MHLATLATPTTTDPLAALLRSPTAGPSPLDDLVHALRGGLGVGLAVAAVVLLALAGHRARQRRRRRAWARDRIIASIAGRGFALYRAAAATPGTDVRALTPSWPDNAGVADLGSPFAAPAAADARPAPWATWARSPDPVRSPG